MKVCMLRATVIRRMGNTAPEVAVPGQVVEVEREFGRWLVQMGKAREATEAEQTPVERAVTPPGEKRGGKASKQNG